MIVSVAMLHYSPEPIKVEQSWKFIQPVLDAWSKKALVGADAKRKGRSFPTMRLALGDQRQVTSLSVRVVMPGDAYERGEQKSDRQTSAFLSGRLG